MLKHHNVENAQNLCKKHAIGWVYEENHMHLAFNVKNSIGLPMTIMPFSLPCKATVQHSLLQYFKASFMQLNKKEIRVLNM